MDNKFDNLFNDFFNNRKRSNGLGDEIGKIIRAIQNFKRNHLIDENLGDAMEAELGPPTLSEEFIEDGLLYNKLVWDTPHGQFVKIVVNNISLEEQLQEALETEDFEKAIVLRDKIKANENNPKGRRNRKSK